MADGRSNNKGTVGNNGGRKPKAEEQKLIEKLSPLEPVAHLKLRESIEQGKDWAIKLFFEYMYGKPKQTIDSNTNLTVTDFNIKEVLGFDNTKREI